MNPLLWALFYMALFSITWVASTWVIVWHVSKRLRMLDYDVKLITRFTGVVVHATHATEKSIWVKYRWWRIATK